MVCALAAARKPTLHLPKIDLLTPDRVRRFWPWVRRPVAQFGKIVYDPCAQASFIAARISSGVTSLMCVANDQLWPYGSVMTP